MLTLVTHTPRSRPPELETSAHAPSFSTRPHQNLWFPIVFGLTIIVVGIGGFSVWAALAPLDSAVIGQGALEVAGNRKDIQHLEGGTVARIVAHDGDFVHKGDLLLELDDTRVAAQLRVLRAQKDSVTARLARLQAERDGRTTIAFPDTLPEHRSASAAADAIRNEQLQFDRRRSATQGQIAILHQRIAQLHEQIRGILAQRFSKQQQEALIEQELHGVDFLFKKGLSTLERLLSLKRAKAQLSGDISAASASIAQAQESIGESQSQILQISKSFQEEVAKDLTKTQVDLSELDGRISTALDIYKHLRIRAPVDGYIVGMNAHTIGGVIEPGKTILQIIPSMENLLVEVRINPADADKVVLGATCQIRFPSLHDRNLPILMGSVVYISADRLTDPRTAQSYFSVRVKLTDSTLTALQTHPLMPGLPAEVVIHVGSRTMLQYLLAPISDAFTKSMREQ